ncbi:MAG: hypothetical protein FWD73_06855 [Polyangiaceae bacterium]|nr:hypothetical protein [Polyangiaceae bacterium]
MKNHWAASNSRRLERGLGALSAMLVALGVVGVAGLHCGGSNEGGLVIVDGASTTSGLDRAECPDAAPVDGDECELPEGSACFFGLCPVRVAQCMRGIWHLGQNAPPLPVCPAAPPESASDCPPCWPASVTCMYGSADCSAADASVNTAVASCADGKWAIDIQPCRTALDIQGDAEQSAD